MRPYTTGGVYLNFEPDAGEERVRAGYGVEKLKPTAHSGVAS